MTNSLSISFTLGKASVRHQTNVAHSNREFIAPNVDQSRTHLNVTYAREYVEDAYHRLFDRALQEYNSRQKQPCRRIQDYYAHIVNSKREEAFYEAIVQFGDCKTAPCGSATGKIVQQMLDEYIHTFQKRNPHLYIFNAVMHLDEASPHLHINFIPYYTTPRKNGLRVGVSMRQALIEQGFSPLGSQNNQLVVWEESERDYMEKILNAHGFVRDDKNAKYAHKTVEEYKRDEDEKKKIAEIRKQRNISDADLSRVKAQQLFDKLASAEQENRRLEQRQQSPYMSFYYSSPDKLSFVLTQLATNGTPYRETENGFEAQECFVDEIRRIEKLYRAPKSGHREKLRQDIDRFLMQSQNLEELLERLQNAGYQIRHGKYIAARPKDGENFIRLKSLGEQYSEYALKNRLLSKKKFETSIDEQIKAEPNKDTPRCMVLQTIRFYTITFAKNALPMRKRNAKKPFSWTNDAELDRLLCLNKRINEGATPELLVRDFAKQEQTVAEWDAAARKSEHDLKEFLNLKEKLEIVYAGKQSAACTYEQALAALQDYPNITKENWRTINKLIADETEKLHRAQAALQEETAKLKETSELVTAMERVIGGTYVQHLMGEERQRRESDFIPNGLKQMG